MNKKALVETVAAEVKLDLTTVEAVLDSVLGAISAALAGGDKVAIAGFGTFETRSRAARAGRNPQTGEPIDIPASTTAAFKPASALKQSL